MRTATLLAALLTLPASLAVAQIGPIEADQARIREHLARVEMDLRAADTSHLDEDQRASRLAALDALHAYWVEGTFPHNEHVDGRNPVFVDEGDRACAVGHLLRVSGHEDVAARIASEQNLARVPDIDDPALGPWLEAHGFTVEEAARIQPSYCHCGFVEEPVCGADGLTYENRCTAEECRGITVASEGACSAGDEVVRDCDCSGPDEPSDGGGCAVSPRRGGAAGAIVVGLLGLALVWRRRRAATER